MMFATDGRIWWYSSRASGVVLWLLVALAVVWGFAVSSRLVRKKGIPAWMLDLHRHLGTLTVVFTAIHLLALWADSFVAFGWRELFVPMASTWRPGAVAWGIVAFYCLVAVQLTSWFKKRLPRKLWHSVHMLSVPLFVTGSAHGIMAGADWPNLVVQWGFVLVSVTVVWLATFRLFAPTKDPANTDRLAVDRAASAAAKAAAATGFSDSAAC
jgi:DMSO/TMAO reductase YedYZ heme-binding membrane subunit